MSTVAERLTAHPPCTAADVDGVVACCTPDVVHYFLAPGTGPVRGAEHLGRYWRKIAELISAEYTVEHAVACDDEAVIEFSQQWTSPEDGKRYVWHGAEWYAFRDGLISEIRAYFDLDRDRDTGLVDFPYVERGYTPPSVGSNAH